MRKAVGELWARARPHPRARSWSCFLLHSQLAAHDSLWNLGRPGEVQCIRSLITHCVPWAGWGLKDTDEEVSCPPRSHSLWSGRRGPPWEGGQRAQRDSTPPRPCHQLRGVLGKDWWGLEVRGHSERGWGVVISAPKARSTVCSGCSWRLVWGVERSNLHRSNATVPASGLEGQSLIGTRCHQAAVFTVLDCGHSGCFQVFSFLPPFLKKKVLQHKFPDSELLGLECDRWSCSSSAARPLGGEGVQGHPFLLCFLLSMSCTRTCVAVPEAAERCFLSEAPMFETIFAVSVD